MIEPIIGQTCPLSEYDFTTSLKLIDGTISTPGTFTTGYDNVQCLEATLTLISANITRVAWSSGSSLTDSFEISMNSTLNETIVPVNVTATHADFLNLKFNTKYVMFWGF